MKICNKLLVDLDGNPLRAGDQIDLTVAQVLTTAALSPPANQQQPRAEKDIAARYDLAIQLHRLNGTGEIDIAVDLVSALKSDVVRIYPTIVVGQMLPVLEGNVH